MRKETSVRVDEQFATTFVAAAIFTVPAVVVSVLSFPYDTWTVVAAVLTTPVLCALLAGAVVLGNRWHPIAGCVLGVLACAGHAVTLDPVAALLRSCLG